MKRKIYLKFVSKLMLVSIIGMTAVGCGSNSDEAKSINDTKTSLYAEADTNPAVIQILILQNMTSLLHQATIFPLVD